MIGFSKSLKQLTYNTFHIFPRIPPNIVKIIQNKQKRPDCPKRTICPNIFPRTPLIPKRLYACSNSLISRLSLNTVIALPRTPCAPSPNRPILLTKTKAKAQISQTELLSNSIFHNPYRFGYPIVYFVQTHRLVLTLYYFQ